MNSIGNRHVGNNIRILLVNNGKGTEFRNYNHPASRFGAEADKFIAAGGHYGNKSSVLVKHYAQDLGFEYMSASSKEEFDKVCGRFVSPEMTDSPIIFEIFTDSGDESDAIQKMLTIGVSAKTEAYKAVRNLIPAEGIRLIKRILK